MKSVIEYIQIGILLLCFLSEKGFAAEESPGADAALGTAARTDMSVYEVSQKWVQVETELLNYITARKLFAQGTDPGSPRENLLTALADFRLSVDGFLHSPLYKSGMITAFSPKDMTRNITYLTEELAQAIRVEQTDAVLNSSEEIRTELARWQYLDSAMADTIHLEYFYQFIIFITLIIIMSLFVWQLNRALEKVRVKGKQSAAFSRQMMLGREQERSRVARELHDSVAQELSALAMKVSQIRHRIDSAEIQNLCTELNASHTGLIARVRTICNDLAQPEFRHQGLADALRKLCYDFGKTANIECRITVMDGFSPDPMPVEMQLQCFRLVQEALTNIRKHAEASEATVVLRNTGYGPGKTRPGLRICVSDDGKGLPSPPGWYTKNYQFPRRRGFCRRGPFRYPGDV
jgi:signal transduction histidine kinase